jgi:hypothetical protein
VGGQPRPPSPFISIQNLFIMNISRRRSLLIRIFLAGLCPLAFIQAQNVSHPLSEWNVSREIPLSPATVGELRLAGEIVDLCEFEENRNPFEWGAWPNKPYESVSVENETLLAVAGASGTDPVRILSSPLAWWVDMDQFRYLELEFSREQSLGRGQLWFRKNGNSLVTPGQTVQFPITNGHHGDRTRIILDLSEIEDWGSGALTGLGLDLHVGTGPSKDLTSDRIYGIRLGSKISTE